MIKTYAQAINEATSQLLASDDSVLLIGEGVPDKSGVFGSTKDLKAQHPTRVFDSPLSENAVTGICIGAAISGMKPIMVHQRADFSLLSMDQIVNNAAKWHSMFGQSCNITIRMIIGRGWGQGPQHSQSFQALFAAIPGLKVVMPTTAYDAKGLLIAAVRDPNPVIILEHRWLYNIQDEVPESMYETPLNKAKVLRTGEDFTIVGFSYGTIEALKAHELLESQGVSLEVIDGISCAPLDIETIANSVRKTHRLIVVDTSHKIGGIGSELIRQVVEKHMHRLYEPPIVIACKDYPQPTSHYLTSDYYPDKFEIANRCLRMLGRTELIPDLVEEHDVPDKNFKGPF